MSTEPTANDVGELALRHSYRQVGEYSPYPGLRRVSTLWYVDFTKDALLAFVQVKWAEMGGTELGGCRSREGLRQVWELAAFGIGIPYRDDSRKGSDLLQEALL